MPNKPKTFKCVKPGCNRVFNKNADFVAHHGKCVLGVLDSLKCSSCGKGFSNSQYWKRHRKNCQPVKKSLLLPLAERLKLAEEKKPPLEKEQQSDDGDLDDNKDFVRLPIKEETEELQEEILIEPTSLVQQDIEDNADYHYEDLNHSMGSNGSSSSKSVYVYTLVGPHLRSPSCVPSFEEEPVDVKQEVKEEEEDEADVFIEEYLEDDFDDDDDDV